MARCRGLVVLVLIACQGRSASRSSAPAFEAVAAVTDGLLLGVHSPDGRTFVAVGGDREDEPPVVLRSGDGGDRWEVVACPGDHRLYGVWFAAPRRGFAVGLGGLLLETRDAGATWRARRDVAEGWLAGIHFADRSVGLIAGGSADGALLLRTCDGGDSWTALRGRLPDAARERQLRAAWLVDASRAFVVGEGGLLLRTDDGGDSWRVVATGTDAWLRSVHFPTRDTGFVAGSDGVVLATGDGGGTWRRLPSAPATKLNAVRFATARLGWLAAMDGRLFETRDGGATWTVAALASGALAAVHVAPTGAAVAVGDDGLVLRRAP